MTIRRKYNLYYHGRRKYGDRWPEIRKKVLIRDGKKCRICNVTKRLHIHHIIPFKISHSNEDLNLVTLCKSCHPKVEKIAWLILEKKGHRFQIYQATWNYIKNEHDKLLTERKSHSSRGER